MKAPWLWISSSSREYEVHEFSAGEDCTLVSMDCDQIYEFCWPSNILRLKKKFELVDEFEEEPTHKIKLLFHKCDCDLYTQLMPYGCKCGGI